MTSGEEQSSVERMQDEAAPGLTIANILQMLLRRIWFILGCAVVCAFIAFLYIRTATPTYEAFASIRIDLGRASSLGLSDLLASNTQDPTEVIHTEIAILQSDEVAIGALDALPDADFEKFAGGPKRELMIPVGSQTVTPRQERLLAAFKGSLQVKQLEETELVVITCRSADPHLAATIVNHVVSAYLRQGFDSRYGSVAQVTTWLSTQMQGLRSRAADAQSKLAQFQEENNIVTTEGPATQGGGAAATTTTDRLRILNERLAAAEADRIVKEAQMRAATTGSQDPAVLTSLYPNPKLQALQEEQGRLYAQYAQLSTKFGPNYTPLVQLKLQMQAINGEITNNVNTVQTRLREEYASAKGTEDMLRSEYDDQTRKAYALNRDQAQLAVLQAEGTASRELYNMLEVKLQQAGIDAGLNAINTMAVDTARAPLTPVEPKRAIVLSFGTILGLLVGIISVFLVEAFADRVQNLEQMGGATGYTTLTTIPHVPGRLQTSEGLVPATVALKAPWSSEAEAYRRLRNLLQSQGSRRALKTICIVSPGVNEGKTTLTANLAVVLAQAGAKVLLVDAEMRRPSLHQIFGVTNEIGLADLLQQDAPAVAPTHPVPGLPELSVLTTGKALNLPSESLSSLRFRNLLETWKADFDYVVFKTAPLLLVSDALLLCSWSDAVLVAARQDVTPLADLNKVRKVLDQLQAHVVGAVINDVSGAPEASSAYVHQGKVSYGS